MLLSTSHRFFSVLEALEKFKCFLLEALECVIAIYKENEMMSLYLSCNMLIFHKILFIYDFSHEPANIKFFFTTCKKSLNEMKVKESTIVTGNWKCVKCCFAFLHCGYLNIAKNKWEIIFFGGHIYITWKRMRKER